MTPKNIADGQLSDSLGDLFTSGAGVTTVIPKAGLCFVNTHTSAITVNLYRLTASGTARRICPKDLSIAATEAYYNDKVIACAPGDKIQAIASVASKVDYTISGADTVTGSGGTAGGSAYQIQYNNAGNLDGVALGTAGHVLTSNGAGVAATMQANAGGRQPIGGEKTSSGSNITWSGLTSSTQRSYDLDVDIAAGGAGAQVNLYVNGDTTDGDYSSGQIYQDASNLIKSAVTGPGIGYADATYDEIAHVRIFCTPGNFYVYHSTRVGTNTAVPQGLLHGFKTASLGGQITSLTISGLPTGSKARLFPAVY